MDEGDGGDRHEAISAVADEGFLGEEDDDYEDLYNDVNVGEGFLQTLRVNNNNNNNKETLAYRNNNNNNDIESVVESTAVSVSIPGVGGELKVEKDMGGVGGVVRMEGHQELGFRGSGGVHGGGGGGGMRVELGQSSVKAVEVERIERQVSVVQDNMGPQQQLGQVQQQNHGVGNEGYGRQGGGGVGGGIGIVGSGGGGGGNVGGGHGVVGNVSINGGGGGGGGVVVGVGGGGGGTILFVGDLHWWTTDAQLESELCKYGSVKEVKFFDEKASGKSKGYCQVEFYDPAAAAACKEGMNGHLFNGRPCVVAFASPYSVRRMGEAQVNKNQAAAQAAMGQGKQVGVDAVGRGRGNSIATGANYQGGDGNRGYGRGNWGRGGGGGGQGMGGRGPVAPMRNRMGDMGGRGIMGNGGSGFGQGLAPTPTMMHPQSMMGQGFDPSYGAHMGRLGGYGGFLAAPAPPFAGMMPSFPPVGGVGLPGVAPHVNPAFFGRGMPGNGMGGMPTAGADGHGMGMWTDPNAAGWGNEDPGGRAGESSYGDDAASDHQYGEASHERGGRPGSVKDKERTSERDWSGPPDRRYRDDREPASEREMPREKDVGRDHDWSEKRHRDDREPGRERDRERERDRDRERDRERDRYKEERDRYSDHHKHRERDLDYENDWERGRAPSSHKSRYEEHRRSRSRDVDYGKRRRLPSK
ncbi:hypothetical protein Scep_028980 [Stephania cephalantha]|uniref:RRM domain-containing protein n=1 Tax=Stephania cephalantha TaxID=152367 RepID=A0AAP0EF58_9MAGN